MRLQPGSFLVGLGAAFALPLLSRVIRPLAVEAVVASLGFFEEARRVIAEQMETMEDIAAEARARREQVLVAAQTNGAEAAVEPEEETVPARPRRRANGAARKHVS